MCNKVSISKRRLLGGLGLSSVLAGLPAEVNAQGNTKKLIYIVTFRGATEVEKGFQDYLKKSGLDIEFVVRDIARDKTRLPGIVNEIRQAKADLVLAWGTSVTEGLVGKVSDKDFSAFLTKIPVVYALVAAPVEAELVSSLASSGRNVTGVYHVASLDKQWSALESYRKFTSMGVVYTPTENNAKITVRDLKSIGDARGVKVIGVPAKLDAAGKPIAASLAEAVKELAANKVNWLYLPPDSFVGANSKAIVIPTAHSAGLPTFATTEQLMDAGSLVGLISHYYDIGAFAGFKALQILKGKHASELPSETLKQFTLRINPAVAKQLNAAPPLGLFGYAEFKT
jgi:putative ABC transport system substrate-binding protein